jgi:HAD superfamily phosphoserine phosphatase-like hydrolase
MSYSSSELVIFDFDGTLYSRDSLLDFCRFYYRKKPYRLHFILHQLWDFVMWKFRRITATEFKNRFIRFIHQDGPEEVQRMAEVFWNTRRPFNTKVLEELRRFQHTPHCLVVLSASPLPFILPACRQLGVEEVIATTLTFGPKQYRLGTNCRGGEKIRRLKERFSNPHILAAYSDNADDLPLLEMAENGFVIKRGEIIPINVKHAVR